MINPFCIAHWGLIPKPYRCKYTKAIQKTFFTERREAFLILTIRTSGIGAPKTWLALLRQLIMFSYPLLNKQIKNQKVV
jgi:hypothetical protein